MRELRTDQDVYSQDCLKSIRDDLRSTGDPDEDRIVEYLKTGHVFIVAPGLETDAVDPTKGFIGTICVRTDGEWTWPGSLAYYVENYHLKVEDDFLEYVRRNNWQIPPEESIDFAKFDPAVDDTDWEQFSINALENLKKRRRKAKPQSPSKPDTPELHTT